MGQLQRIYDEAEVKPSVVQQRMRPMLGLERELRDWCAGKGIYLQLSESMQVLRDEMPALVGTKIQPLVEKYGVTPYTLLFRFLMALGMVPLTAADNEDLMKED